MTSDTVVDITNVSFKKNTTKPAPYDHTAVLYKAFSLLLYRIVSSTLISILMTSYILRRGVNNSIIDCLNSCSRHYTIYTSQFKGGVEYSVNTKKVKVVVTDVSLKIYKAESLAPSQTIYNFPKILVNLNGFFNILVNQCRMSWKKLEHIIDKLRSIHLAIPCTIGNF